MFSSRQIAQDWIFKVFVALRILRHLIWTCKGCMLIRWCCDNAAKAKFSQYHRCAYSRYTGGIPPPTPLMPQNQPPPGDWTYVLCPPPWPNFCQPWENFSPPLAGKEKICTNFTKNYPFSGTFVQKIAWKVHNFFAAFGVGEILCYGMPNNTSLQCFFCTIFRVCLSPQPTPHLTPCHQPHTTVHWDPYSHFITVNTPPSAD